MINAVAGILAFILVFLLFIAAAKVVDAIHGPVKLRKPLVNYNKIREMELEIYGHEFDGDRALPTPRQQRQTEAANHARALEAQAERLLRDQAQWNPGPDWTDEDGRPW